MLRFMKRTVVAAGRSSGMFKLLADSQWRNSRLLILGYHSFPLKDEVEWNPALYMAPGQFRSRMEAIRRHDCTVLELGVALDLLQANKLPPRSVVLTFDDGTCDFYEIACPILKEFGYPATLYLTTYYVTHPFPVTPGVWRYMFWNKRRSVVETGGLLGDNARFDLRTREGRDEAVMRLAAFAGSQGFNGEQRNRLTRQLAELLGFDYEDLCRRRMFHLLRPADVKAVAAQGVSVQLHTHRHYSPDDREQYLREIEDNKREIVDLVGTEPRHFCYPSGAHKPQYVQWLRDAGIESATTCDLGIVERSTDRLLLPRLVDTSSLSDEEFEGWLAGFGALLPHRKRHA
jgi:peptidoglycan/xylan/chitin deacetylase (PgdA/CDA1 family)